MRFCGARSSIMECCSFGSCSLSWPAISCTGVKAVGFQLSRQQFDIIHYAGMGIFKLGIILFNSSGSPRSESVDFSVTTG